MITPAHATTFMGGEPGEEINIPHLPSHTTAVAGDLKKINLTQPTLSLAEPIPKGLFLLPQSADNSNASNDYPVTTHLPPSDCRFEIVDFRL
jgi:hypothetical protein